MFFIRAKKRVTLIGTEEFYFLLKMYLRKNHKFLDRNWKVWCLKDLFDAL